MKIQVEVPDAEARALEKIAAKLGLSVVILVQQEVDQAITSASVWLQRADILTA